MPDDPRSEPSTAAVESAALPDAERFVRRYYRGTAEDELAHRSPESLRAAALAHLRLARERQAEQTKLRIYSPRLDEDGWRSPRSVVDIVTDDMPFLVDSTMAALAQDGIMVHDLVHPILDVVRDQDGRWLGLADSDQGGGAVRRESFIHAEIDDVHGSARREQLETHLRQVLGDVRAAVGDWSLMRAQLASAAEYLATADLPFGDAERDEAVAFLNWLADDNFTLLGYREYRLVDGADGPELAIVPASGLGILRDPHRRLLRDSTAPTRLPPETAELVLRREPLITTKSRTRSPVHRPVQMDHIGVKLFGPGGAVIGERRFIGLFTSSAYHRSTRQIPLIRRKVRWVLERAGFPPDSHDGKALLNILETYPRDELFQLDTQDLYDAALGILRLETRPRVRLFFRRDPFGRFFSVLAYVPRERFNSALRGRLAAVLDEAFGGPAAVVSTEMGESPLARIHFFVPTTPERMRAADLDALQRTASQAARTWDDDLADALAAQHGEDSGKMLVRRYSGGFSAAYRDTFPPVQAVHDIARMEKLTPATPLGFYLDRQAADRPDIARFHLYRLGAPVPLSDSLPVLENLGFRVIEEQPYSIRRAEGDEVSLGVFMLQEPRGGPIDVRALKEPFAEAFARIWDGDAENDGFNRLVVAAGLEWRDVALLRALAKYLRQAGMAFSQSYIEATLVAYPDLCRLFLDLFRVRFDPDLDGARGDRAAEIDARIAEGLDRVASLDHDRILRRYANLIAAMLRTNFFQPVETTGVPGGLISFKLDSRRVLDLPAPRPATEIFVYAPRLEAIHLRGGAVARGGIRWSDRREDFRTEILALQKAQQVKNAVIVPSGAKGGFVPKALPSAGAREAVQDEALACYRLFMDALLDLTDNLVDGAVVPPSRVVRHDGDDPYLVVAADKGTATFSDTANAIAQEHGYWLGDAFASGGSAGYDHKAMGITARGAWESVKRHFLELGTDIQTTPFRVVGVGDMSGDVFGNGMLQSDCIRLVAAFDHRHIFVDPNPDPARSFAERKRLFALPRSSWADYDPALISAGGGVFPRTAKSIRLTPEIQALTGLTAAQATPAELVRALLAAETDLLWFGGIGTFVKASDESNAEVGDRANDALRIDGRDLRARVVGEGANLACTQRGRIEYALAGGRLNMDAIDNSAGVDCSDHEVNIKIALREPVERGALTIEARNALLIEMTDEVASLVLADNILQARAISVERRAALAERDWHAGLMRALEREGRLDRAVAFLPSDEALAQRAAAGEGLTRPELAMLLSHAKLALNDELLAGPVPDEPHFRADLDAYFPGPARAGFADAIGRHPLRRNIVATVLANALVNRGGIAFASRLREESGADFGDIVRAFAIARAAFGLDALWAALDRLDRQVPAELSLSQHYEVRQFLHGQVLWLLRNARQPIALDTALDEYTSAIGALARGIEAALPPDGAAALAAHRAELAESGLPPEIADRLAALRPLEAAFDIVQVARALDRPVERTAHAYFSLGLELGLDRLKAGLRRIETRDYWERRALQAVVEELYAAQRTLTRQALLAAPGATPDAAVQDWLSGEQADVGRVRRAFADLEASGPLTLPKLTLAGRLLHGLTQD